MRYWLIRAQAPSIKLDLETKALTITSRRLPQIKVDDVLVLMTGDKKKRIFSHIARVANEPASKVVNDGSKWKTKIDLSELKEFPESNDVDLFSFSLTFVRNLLRPELHFRRGYRLIPSHDFHTILNGEAFVARTGYYEFLRALPATLRASFEGEELLLLAADKPVLTFGEKLTRLQRFIQTRVLSVGALLSELNTLIHRMSLHDGDGIPFNHLIDDEASSRNHQDRYGDDIAVQAKLFENLHRSLNLPFSREAEIQDMDLVTQILTDLKNPGRRAIEKRFEKLFEASR